MEQERKSMKRARTGWKAITELRKLMERILAIVVS
jgi:hypothetical protein